MAYYSQLTEYQAESLENKIKNTLDEQVQELSTQIQIKSEKAEREGNAPFGKAIQASLDGALALARRMGFQTRDLDGYVGIISYGEGEETLGVLAHLDVVPAGAGWSVAPFGGVIKDGCVYGRGTCDDKGPALNALYALYAIKECGISLTRKVEIILGCDEESGWACMDHYKSLEKMPDIAFSPDGEYPLVFSEKAIVQATYKALLNNSRIKIKCGERSNVVPGEAEAVLNISLPELHLPEGYFAETSQEPDGMHLKIIGLGAHASQPQLGRNALLMLLKVLAELPLEKEDKAIVEALHGAFQLDLHGETLGLDTEDFSGRLTINPAILHWDEKELVFTYDSRCPNALDPNKLVEATTKALAPAGLMLSDKHIKAGHHVPLTSPLVTKLMGVYQAQTGDTQSKPLAIGGGTYARAMPVAVAFGCDFPEEPCLAHMPDERVSIERIQFNTRMMADAIIALGND